MLLFGRAGLVRIARPVSDFYVANRLMPALFNAMAIAVSSMAVLVFVGAAGGVGPAWQGVTPLLLGGAIGLILSGILLAPYLRGYGGYTLPDFLAERFGGDKVRPLAVLAVILCSFPALATILLAIGLIGAAVFALPVVVSVGGGVAMILVCILIGGMRSLSLSQIAQYAVLLAVSVVAVLVVLWQTGTIGDTERLLVDEVVPDLRLQTFAQSDAANRFALIFCLAAGIASLPFLLMRSFTTPSASEARISFLAAPFFAGLLCLAAPALAALFEPARVAAGDALSMIAEGLLLVGAIAGLLAAGGALALSVANALSYDVYFKTLQPTASARRQLSHRASVGDPRHMPCRGRGGACSQGDADRHGRGLLAGGERLPAGAGAWGLVEARHERRGPCRHDRRAPRVFLLHDRAARDPVRLLRVVELSLQRQRRPDGRV